MQQSRPIHKDLPPPNQLQKLQRLRNIPESIPVILSPEKPFQKHPMTWIPTLRGNGERSPDESMLAQRRGSQFFPV